MKPEDRKYMDLFGDDIIGIMADELKKLGLNEKQVKETWDMVLVALQDSPEIRQNFFECWKMTRETVDRGDINSWQGFYSVLLPHIWLYAMTIREYPKKVEQNVKEMAEFTEKVMDRISGIVEGGA